LDRRSLIDGATIVIALLTLAVLWRWKKAQEPVIVVAAALEGLLIRSLLP
jgi:chromate transporter